MIGYLEFVVFTLGFFAAISVLIWLLTYLEQTLPQSGSMQRLDAHVGTVDDESPQDPTPRTILRGDRSYTAGMREARKPMETGS